MFPRSFFSTSIRSTLALTNFSLIPMSQAYILGHLVTATFNDLFPISRLSGQLAATLKVSHSRTELPINANMGSGSLTSLVEFEVDDRLCSDVVLGRNWFADYREYMISENLLTSTQIPCEAQKRDTGELNLILFLVRRFTFFRCHR